VLLENLGPALEHAVAHLVGVTSQDDPATRGALRLFGALAASWPDIVRFADAEGAELGEYAAAFDHDGSGSESGARSRSEDLNQRIAWLHNAGPGSAGALLELRARVRDIARLEYQILAPVGA